MPRLSNYYQAFLFGFKYLVFRSKTGGPSGHLHSKPINITTFIAALGSIVLSRPTVSFGVIDMFKIVILLTMFSALNISAETYERSPASKVIYGHDDRYDVDDYSDPIFIEKARSVAMRVSNKRLSEDRDDSSLMNFPFRKLKNDRPLLCSDERFREQIVLGECSGFLVAPNKLVTAGHCMNQASACTKNLWVFDFKKGTTQINKNNVYSCKKIISQKFSITDSKFEDYAVIELDRNVTDREPLAYRKSGKIDIETPLVVIGHPMGLPMKIADGAQAFGMNEREFRKVVQSWLARKNYFTANLDAMGGNSGSPVFNKVTGEVEGILSEGADDFVFNKNTLCEESVRISDSPKKALEKVMRITKVPGL
jgi:V8-like Glu-specific endopeptidase